MKTLVFYITKTLIYLWIIWIITVSGYFLYNYTVLTTWKVETKIDTFTFENSWELLKNCKIMKKDNVELDTYSLKCWNFYNKVHFVKITWIEVPKEWECWFTELSDYLKTKLSKKTLRFKVLWHKDNFEYWYLYYWNENIIKTILEKGLANYKEDWLHNEALIKTWETSKNLPDWFYKQCNKKEIN